MDEGTLSNSSFTVFDEEVSHDLGEVAKLLATTYLKVMTARRAREQLSKELQVIERIYYSAVDVGRASAQYAMSMSITSLLTTGHLLDRYLLLLARDCLLLESCLRGAVPMSYWRSWRSSLGELRERIPNVHDYFLWQISIQSQDEEEEDFSGRGLREGSRHLGLVLRRDAQ